MLSGLVVASCSSDDASVVGDRQAAPVETTVSETTVIETTAIETTATEPVVGSTTSASDPAVDPVPVSSSTSTDSLPLSCVKSVTVGPLTVRVGNEVECLERRGLTWSSRATVTVGGVKFVALDPQSRIVFDAFNARVRASGYEAVGSVLGADLVLASGEIDWSFQYRPDQNTGLGRFMPTQSDIIDLTLVSQLPGLGDVRSLPKDPVSGFVDYSTVSEESVALLVERFPTIAGPDVRIPLSALGLTAVPVLTISLPTKLIQSLTGLEVGGAVTMQPVERDGSLGMVIGGAVRLPAVLERAEGVFAFFIPLNGSTQIDELRVDVPRIDFGVGRIENLLLNYDAPTKTWSGGALVLVGPGTDAIGVGGTVSVVDGRLQTIGVKVAGLPVDIAGVLSLNRLGGTLRIDPFSLEATAQIGIGPFVPGVGNLAVIDGGVEIGETEIAASGVMKIGTLTILGQSLPGLQIADARIGYRWDGVASISGNGYLSFDVGESWSIRGGFRGAANATAVSVAGNVSVALGPLFTLSGVAAVGTRGAVACAVIGSTWFTSETRIGIAHDWGSGRVEVRGSECNTKAYEVPTVASSETTSAGSAASIGDSPTVAFVRSAAPAEPTADGVELDIPNGQQMLTIAVPDDAADAAIIGPDGTRIDVSGGEVETDDPDNPRWIVLQPPGSDVRSVLVGSPAGGTWVVETQQAAVDSIQAEVVSAESQPRTIAAETLEAVPVSTDTTQPGESSATDVPSEPTAETDPTEQSTETVDEGSPALAPGSTVSVDGSSGGDGSLWWVVFGLLCLAAVGVGITRVRAARSGRPPTDTERS